MPLGNTTRRLASSLLLRGEKQQKPADPKLTIKEHLPEMETLDQIALLLMRFDRCCVSPDVCESAADAKGGRHDQAIAAFADPWLVCLAPVMHHGLFRGPQHQIVSYDNEFTVKWRRGLDWKQRS
jgi:hypothetical protein